jgi:U6 snRNA-associated Sm-like protein LSm3
MVLSDVEETITTREIDEETFEEHVKVFSILFLSFQKTKRTIDMLFVRGDGVILISPPILVR